MHKSQALNDPLLLYAGHGFVPQEVLRKEVSSGHQTLGAWLNPNNTFKDEVVYLRQVSNKLAGCLQQSHLSMTEVRTAYRSIYLPKLCYGASVASFTQEQCWEVEYNAVGAFLSALEAACLHGS